MSAVEIPLSRGLVTTVDEEDADLAGLQWYATLCKGSEYARRDVKVGGRRDHFLLHRVIMERMLGRPLLNTERIDHKDRDKFNNARSNLRLATNSQNQANTADKPGRALPRGVYLNHSRVKPFQAQIWIEGKRRCLGSFMTAEEAHEAHREASLAHFGEFSPYHGGD